MNIDEKNPNYNDNKTKQQLWSRKQLFCLTRLLNLKIFQALMTSLATQKAMVLNSIIFLAQIPEIAKFDSNQLFILEVRRF